MMNSSNMIIIYARTHSHSDRGRPFTYLSTEAAGVFAVLRDFHLLHGLSKGGTISCAILAHNANLLSALGLQNSITKINGLWFPSVIHFLLNLPFSSSHLTIKKKNSSSTTVLDLLLVLQKEYSISNQFRRRDHFRDGKKIC